jgi:hypothetical protein
VPVGNVIPLVGSRADGPSRVSRDVASQSQVDADLQQRSARRPEDCGIRTAGLGYCRQCVYEISLWSASIRLTTRADVSQLHAKSQAEAAGLR